MFKSRLVSFPPSNESLSLPYNVVSFTLFTFCIIKGVTMRDNKTSFDGEKSKNCSKDAVFMAHLFCFGYFS